MIELAEDERQVFTERMVAEALKGKTPSESPTFYALVGAPGSGKSTLASTIDNAVVPSIRAFPPLTKPRMRKRSASTFAKIFATGRSAVLPPWCQMKFTRRRSKTK